MVRIVTSISLGEREHEFLQKQGLKASTLLSDYIGILIDKQKNRDHEKQIETYEKELLQSEQKREMLWDFIRAKNMGEEFLAFKANFEKVEDEGKDESKTTNNI